MRGRRREEEGKRNVLCVSEARFVARAGEARHALRIPHYETHFATAARFTRSGTGMRHK